MSRLRAGVKDLLINLPESLFDWVTQEVARQKTLGLSTSRNAFLVRLIADAKRAQEQEATREVETHQTAHHTAHDGG